MKALLNVCCVLSLVCLLYLAAGHSASLALPEFNRITASHVARSSTPAVFNSYDRMKVLQYFDTFRSDPMGLPAGWAAKIMVNNIPAEWTKSPLAAGIVVQESDRGYLLGPPPELVRVLPASRQDLRYYVAGCNLVAVDPNFKVVDSVRIPSIILIGRSESASPLQLIGLTEPRYK